VRAKGDREWTVFLDATAVHAIRAYVNGRSPSDIRRWVFVSHGNRRRRNDRLSPWSVWSIVKNLARQAELADPHTAHPRYSAPFRAHRAQCGRRTLGRPGPPRTRQSRDY
jgi:site-specific recombinase XerD